MSDALRHRIDQVTDRFRKRCFGWSAAVIAMAVAVVGAMLLPAARSGQISGSNSAIALAAIGMLGLLLAYVLSRRSYTNERGIATRIENQFPSLQQRLLTAVTLANQTEPLGFLQRQVVREAYDHSRIYRWPDTVPSGQLVMSRLLGASATVMMGAVLATLFISQGLTRDAGASSKRIMPLNVTVEPGNTEIERGSSLVITARFEGLRSGAERGSSGKGQSRQGDEVAPTDGELLLTAKDGTQRRLTMTQNLNDPILAAFIAAVDAPLDYRITTPVWTSDTYSVDVFDFPAVLRSDADLEFPDYTGLPARHIEDTVRVAAVEGTQLTWTCFLNKSVRTAELIAEDGVTLPLVATEDTTNTWSVGFTMDETRRFKVRLIDDAGRENKYPPQWVATVLPNQAPELKLKQAGDATVSPLEEFPIVVETSDDFGVQRAGLSYTFAGQNEEIILKRDVPRGATETIEHLVEFEKLKAEPDQLFAYHFWAEDIGPDGQPRRTQSDMYFAEVRPFEQIFREGEPPPNGPPSAQQSPNGQEAEELAELQKEVMNATWRVIRDETENQLGEGAGESVALLVEGQREALGLLEDLASKLSDAKSIAIADSIRSQMSEAVTQLEIALGDNKTSPLQQALSAEQASYSGLLKLRAREFEVTRSQRQNQSSSSSASQKRRQQQLDDLELEQNENRYETQNQAEANDPQEQAERENRQILSRLKELARRQEDLNEQLAQLQSALEQAKTPEQKEQVQRQLQRLREQQQDMLRETDELSERMQQPENQAAMQQANQQLQETRENVRQAAEALEQNDASKALTSGKRAEREFEQMRDEFRRQSAGQFNDAVRQMRDQVQQLDEKQRALSEAMTESEQQPTPGLREGESRQEIEAKIAEQRKRLSELQQQMQTTVEEAEDAEPLLAEKLYDSFRQSEQRQIDRRLGQTNELLRRGYAAQAQETEQMAAEGIEGLREDLEAAATAVLGDETEGLRRSLGELEQLTRDLEKEMESARSSPSNDPSNPNPQSNQADEPQQGRSPQQGSSGESGERSEDDSQSTESQNAGQSQGDPRSEGDQRPPTTPGNGPSQQPGDGSQPSDGGQPTSERQQQQQSQSQQSGTRSGGLSQFAADSPNESASGSPLTGDGFREWTDRLRDVEEMLDSPELRSRANRIRDRARDVRVDLQRKSKNPQWDLVDEMIAEPLRELRRDVQEELMRRSAEKNSLVPIDRDPVPDQYSDAVRRYYENLGSGR
ncbi:DUF4175 family protein [Novipirellula artificiosorum]|uniref:Uncharacterized protein n=1 Tax=Novipirellula artificiosorum TaxID=2528016 RepID=A0A5C6DXH8_9BACT|nr:DUF4175 family protein [Novipirellula artificiosorum]TWU41105.1 hypothetical protein Poly41_19430 [Novipirellula artificiosorum]